MIMRISAQMSVLIASAFGVAACQGPNTTVQDTKIGSSTIASPEGIDLVPYFTPACGREQQLVMIRNNGTTDAPASFTTLRLGGQTQSLSTKAIAAQHSETVYFMNQCQGCEGEVVVLADADGDVDEVDEDNNRATDNCVQ